MTAAPQSGKETLRLAKLHNYGILDTLPEKLYDDITVLASHICQTPMALVSLIDSRRQWFKSKVGISESEMPRSVAFCSYTIEGSEVMIVEDTHLSPRFRNNPLVTGPPFIRFYAGAPLITPDGYALGSLCVIDTQPHQLSAAQLETLRVLADQVVAQIELHHQRQQLKLSNSQLERKVKDRTASLASSLHRLLRSQVTLLKREALSRHSALHDPLTQLPNRNYFLQRLNQSIQLTHRQPKHNYAVLFIDLDNFKAVNDTLGHDVGDELLVHVAEQLQRLLRKSDLVARLGGDEFAVLLDNLPDEDQAVNATKRLQQSFKVPAVIAGHQISVGASIGITFGQYGYRTPEAALKDADTAMYRAKKEAKQRAQKQLDLQIKTKAHPSPILIQNELSADHQQFVVFNTVIQKHAQARLTLEDELRQAVIQHQFQLHYQPIFGLAPQRLLGFEMLLRWNHPTRGLLKASEFIEAAEKIGITQRLCTYTIQNACRQMVKWRSHPAWKQLTLHINLSLMQIQYPPLLVQWQAALSKYDIPASAFQMEIAEQLLISEDPNITKVLTKLRALGFQLCVDNFGRGHSSLSRLHQLAVSALKVDRSFVQALDSQQSMEVTKTIVDFGRSANMSVIAKGIETSDQMNQLLVLGCEQAQGIWLSDALQTEEIDSVYLPQ
ncbi:MAG: EAL domain-containing protein [Cyanobacteria bacterium J06560_2]